jgi:hypothetical protein
MADSRLFSLPRHNHALLSGNARADLAGLGAGGGDHGGDVLVGRTNSRWRDWTPLLFTLVAYRQMDWFTPVATAAVYGRYRYAMDIVGGVVVSFAGIVVLRLFEPESFQPEGSSLDLSIADVSNKDGQGSVSASARQGRR